jgi:2-oxoglutarate ferredoxin oxidoreductase subunit delta
MISVLFKQNGLEMTISRKRPQQKHKKAALSEKQRSSRPKNKRKPKQLFDQIIFRDWCKACGICSAFCPKNVIGLDENGVPFIEHPDDCIGCRFCEIHCPDFAITIKKRPTESKRKSS